MRIATRAMLTSLLASTPALAPLPPGASAPDFSAAATLGGNAFSFHLTDALKTGPVVMYFYPAAFTSGCTAEAHAFAAAVPQFAALHATVVGVSMDGIDKLKKFSVSDCASKFALASDANGQVSRAYDAVMMRVMPMSSRTSYVISPAGKVIYSYEAMDPDQHVDNTLKAVRDYEAHPAR